jgi:multiple sugar transport system permease protein
MSKKRKLPVRFLPFVLLTPAILTILLLWLYPHLYLFYLTLFRQQGSQYGYVGFSNFADLASDDLFYESLYTGLLFTAGSVFGTTLLGLGMALLFNVRLRGTRFYRTVLLVPMVLPAVVSAMTWKILYNPAFGFYDYVLGLFGIPAISWLGSSTTALFAVLLFNVWQNTPFVCLIFSAALLTLPREPLEAAQIDGASDWQAFKYVTVQLLKPTILLVLIFRTMWSFQALDEIYVLTGGGPGYSTLNLTLYAFLTSFFWLRFNYGAALVVVSIAIVGVLTVVYLRLVRTGGGE